MKNASEEQEIAVLLFAVGEITCAVDMACLSEVTAPMVTTPLPFVPKFVDGLVNISGRILPQINAMTLLGTAIHSLQTLLVLDVNDVPIALCVNQILHSITITPADITAVDSPEQSLIGQFSYQGKDVSLFNSEQLLNLVHAGKSKKGKASFVGELKDDRSVKEQFSDFLFFQVASKDYAIKLADVDEIIELDSLSSQPRAPAIIAGISLVRSEPRLIVNFSKLLGKDNASGGRALAIVIDMGLAYIGLLIDHLIGIESIRQSKVRSKTVERDNGSIVPTLHITELLAQNMPAIKPFIPTGRKLDRRIIVKQEELLLFSINGDTYALQAKYVQRIVSDRRLEPLLSPYAWIIGTTEIEGRILPVVDLQAQLGYQSDKQQLREYIVVDDGKQEWALAITLSEQILAVDEDAIDKVDLESTAYVEGFVNNKEQLITILNPLTICHDNQQQYVV